MGATNDFSANTDSAITQDEYRRRVRKLAHDLRSPLSVICMGLEALEFVREDQEQFNTIRQMMQSAGTELKEFIDYLAPNTSADDLTADNLTADNSMPGEILSPGGTVGNSLGRKSQENQSRTTS
jgi:hypothetical protein